jgi:hypothetical protein
MVFLGNGVLLLSVVFCSFFALCSTKDAVNNGLLICSTLLTVSNQIMRNGSTFCTVLKTHNQLRVHHSCKGGCYFLSQRQVHVDCFPTRVACLMSCMSSLICFFNLVQEAINGCEESRRPGVLVSSSAVGTSLHYPYPAIPISHIRVKASVCFPVFMES